MKDPKERNTKYDSDIQKLINSNLNAINNPGARIQEFIEPEYQVNLESSYKQEIEEQIDTLTFRISELLPFVTNIRTSIKNIAEHTYFCGLYLLLCTIIESFNSIIQLSKTSSYLDIMTLNRKIDEAMTQFELFIADENNGDYKNIQNWFSGKTIDHSIGRQNNYKSYRNVPVNLEEMSKYQYKLVSHISHNGYIGMLEMISPFDQDFAFEGSTRFCRTIGGLAITIGKVTRFNVTLKSLYFSGLKDSINFDLLDEILKKNNPAINQINISDQMQSDFPKI